MSHHPVSHRFGFRRGDAHPRSLIEKAGDQLHDSGIELRLKYADRQVILVE